MATAPMATAPMAAAPMATEQPADAHRAGLAVAEDLKLGVQELIGQSLTRAAAVVSAAGRTLDADLPALARDIEAALRAAAADSYAYSDSFSQVCRALPEPYGECLEGTLAEFAADGRVPLADIHKPEVAKSYLGVTGGEISDPRRKMRGCIYQYLSVDPRLDGLCAGYAERIERSCFNAAIFRCAESEYAFRRRWESPEFVTIYNARTGVVISNLDPQGSVARIHGLWALEQLVTGTISPDEMGGMEAADLCPRASERERAEIDLRSQQQVIAKESRIFRCTLCGARRHTIPDTGTQMAAGDEASTYMVTCFECEARFEGRG